MTTFTLVAATTREARRAVRRLGSLDQQAFDHHDAALLDWSDDQDRPTGWQLRPFDTTMALSGSFWGLLFAHLFLLPRSHTQTVAHPDETAETSLAHLGLPPGRLATIRTAVGPGTTAAFFLLADDLAEAPAAAFPGARCLIFALGDDEQQRLYAGFGEVAVANPGR